MTWAAGEFGRRVRAARKSRGFSVGALASRAALAESYVGDLERGEIERPELEALHAVACALDVSMLELLLDPPRNQSPEEMAAHQRREWATFSATLPAALQRFVEQESASGSIPPEDVVRSLASIDFHGNGPTGVDGWRALFRALMRGIEP